MIRQRSRRHNFFNNKRTVRLKSSEEKKNYCFIELLLTGTDFFNNAFIKRTSSWILTYGSKTTLQNIFQHTLRCIIYVDLVEAREPNLKAKIFNLYLCTRCFCETTQISIFNCFNLWFYLERNICILSKLY